jgi:hypothetical protein
VELIEANLPIGFARYIPARDFDDNTDRDHRCGGAEASDDTDRGG